jgi:lipopolysaccharide export system permease protein
VPGHFYELFPIAVLIGTIYSLARMAQSSEFTILRTGGLGPGRALRLLATLGVAFAALNFVVGDYVAPRPSGRQLALKAASTAAASSAAPAPG